MEKKDLIQLYTPEVNSLTKTLWEESAAYKENPYSVLPKWFKEIMLKRAEGMLQLAYNVKNNWVIFPEYSPNYSLVIYKKFNQDFVKKIQRLQMRYFENISAPNSDKFARTATSIFNMKITKNTDKQVIRLEDEMLLMFSFPTTMLRSVLITLGASPDVKF